MEIALLTNSFAFIAIVISIFLVLSSRKAERLRRSVLFIEQERNRLNAILSSMGEALIVVDIETNILLMNQAAAVLIRLAPKEAYGKAVEDVLHIKVRGKSLDIRMELEEIMRSINQKKVGMADDYVITNKSAMSFPASIILTPLLQGGKMIGAIILFQDITKEKEISKAKNEFVSFVSHQLRTPLGSMRWNMEMLMEGGFGDMSDDASHALSDMHKANQFLIDLVNQLLDISRIESGKITDQPRAVDAKDAVEGVISMVAGEAESREVDIELKSTDKKLSPVWVDPNGFQSAIQNLLANAIKYNKPGGKVAINVSKEDDGLLIKITDTGIGIPEEDQSNIFSKFYRASNAARGSVQGTGLGLFAVKSFIERNEGKIWFFSKEGQGTTFYISMPFFINNWHSTDAQEE